MDEPADPLARQLALSALTTEQFNLQTARMGTIAEANGRSALYLGTLSSAVIAIAFVGQANQLGDSFYLFALTLLPPVFLLGVFSYLRLVQTSIEDLVYAVGSFRIRQYFLRLDPAAVPFFPQTDPQGIAKLERIGVVSTGPLQMLLTAASMVACINAIVGGVTVALAVRSLLDAAVSVAAVTGRWSRCCSRPCSLSTRSGGSGVRQPWCRSSSKGRARGCRGGPGAWEGAKGSLGVHKSTPAAPRSDRRHDRSWHGASLGSPARAAGTRTARPRARQSLAGQVPATARSCHSPSTPFSRCGPRSRSTIPEPVTRSCTVRDTRISPRASAFSRYGAYVRIVADDPAVPDQCRSSVHRCAAAWFEPAES